LFVFVSCKKAASEKAPLSHCRKNITGPAGGYDLRLRYPAGDGGRKPGVSRGKQHPPKFFSFFQNIP